MMLRDSFVLGDLKLKALDVFKEDPNIFGYFGKSDSEISVTSAFVAVAGTS